VSTWITEQRDPNAVPGRSPVDVAAAEASSQHPMGRALAALRAGDARCTSATMGDGFDAAAAGSVCTGAVGPVRFVWITQAPSAFVDAWSGPHNERRHFALLQMGGCTELELGLQRARLLPGDIALVRDTAPLALHHETEVEQLVLLNPLEAAGHVLRHGAGLTLLAGGVPATRHAWSWWADACMTPTLQDLADPALLVSALAELLAGAMVASPAGTAADAGPARRPDVALVQHYMNRHLGRQRLGLADVASAFGCSPRSLQRALAEATGETFSHTLQRLRAQALATALRDSSNTGAAVGPLALRCGFSSAAAAARSFRRHFASSPSAYRSGKVPRDVVRQATLELRAKAQPGEHFKGAAGISQWQHALRWHFPNRNPRERSSAYPWPCLEIDEPEVFEACIHSGRIGALRFCCLRASPASVSLPEGITGAIVPWQAMLQLQGSLHVESAGQQCTLHAGELLLLREPVLRVSHQEPIAQIVIWPDPPSHEIGGPLLRVQPLDTHGPGRLLLQWLLEACRHATGTLPAVAAGPVGALLSQMMLRLMVPSAAARPPTRLSRDAVLQHVQAQGDVERLTPGDIARALGCSVRSVHRAFRREGEPSLASFLMMRRLQACAAALRRPTQRDATLTELALRHGFASAAHFSTAFRRYFGVSPTTLRRTAGSDRDSA
jgi:AraC-like DNA-binding protein